MTNWYLYETHLLGGNPNRTKREASIMSQKDFFLREVINNPGYHEEALRNGKSQAILITKAVSGSICQISVMPDNELNIGDLIKCFEGYWIVVDVSSVNPVTKSGTMWLCNQKFRFQNGSSTVIEKYGIIDSGSYSKSAGNPIVDTVNAGYKIYLPSDLDTQKLFVGKRLAVNQIFNKLGEAILETYDIKWIDTKSQNGGIGDGLIILTVASGEYNKTTDNLSLLLCDYIEPVEGETSDSSTDVLDGGQYNISGRSKIRIGTSCSYNITLLDNDGEQIEISNPVDYTVIFSGEAASIADGVIISNNSFILSCPMNYQLIGKSVTIKVHCISETASDIEMTVGVINVG